jgi:5,6,7,8-tetrahydromethanopterin hydro-lyase
MTPQIGAASAGEGPEAVQVTTVLGEREGPVGTAWATSIATPSVGHSPFVVVARPNLPVVPRTLFVPAVDVVSQGHAQLTMGAAQAGVAAAVLDLKMDDPDGTKCLIVSVWVGPEASDEEAVFRNTHDATVASLKVGASGGPWHGHLAEVEVPENPNFRQGR